MSKVIKLELVVYLDETDDLESAVLDLSNAVSNRVFGEGCFSEETLVEDYRLHVYPVQE